MPDLPNGLERLLPGDITWREVMNDNIARLDRAWIDRGLASERPDSAATGHARFWYATDTNVLSWDTGSGWIDVADGSTFPVDLTSDVTGILPVENGGTGLSSIAANNILYTSANDTLEAAAITAFGRSLIDDADAATARGTLGLGTLAVENAAAIGVNLIPDGSRSLGALANPWLTGFMSSHIHTQVGNDFNTGTGRFQIIRGGNSHSLCWDKDRQNFFLGTNGADSTNGVLAVLGLRTRTTGAGGDIGESAYRFGTAFLNDIDLPDSGTIEIGDVELSRAGTGRLGVDSLLTGDGTGGAPAVSIGVAGTGLSRSGTNVSLSIGGANRYRWENDTAYYGFNSPNLGQSANRWGTGFLNNIDLPNAGKIDIGDVELSRESAGVLVLDGERLRAPRLESEIVIEMRRFGNRPRLSMVRANGTRESPTDVTTGQTISSEAYWGFIDGSFRNSCEVVVDIDGTPSGTVVPMRYDLYTQPSGGSLTRRMSIRAAGQVEFGVSTTFLPVAASSVPNNSIFLDSADNVLKKKNNSGTVSNL